MLKPTGVTIVRLDESSETARWLFRVTLLNKNSDVLSSYNCPRYRDALFLATDLAAAYQIPMYNYT